jgi:membrane protease YdiL (CAAX protease family)
MRNPIQRLSATGEVWIVAAGAFGWAMVSSLRLLLYPGAAPPLTERRLESLLTFEAIMLALLAAFLWMRGWRFARFGIRPTLTDTLRGFGLAFATYVVYVATWYISAALGLQPGYAGSYRELAAHDLSLQAVIAVSLLNPFYEEVFLCGYLVTVAKDSGRLSAGVNGSIAIRLVCHLYQGGVGVLTIVPLGLLFTWWYARTGRLWPVLVAHALIDLTSMLQFLR